MKLNNWLALLRLLVLIAVLFAGGVATPTFARPADSKIVLRDDDDKDDDDEKDDDKDEDEDEEDDDDKDDDDEEDDD